MASLLGGLPSRHLLRRLPLLSLSSLSNFNPRTPQTPAGGSTYQLNVNRTKTKKWVEAKIQSYDGDDWGAEDFEGNSEPDCPEEEAPLGLPDNAPIVGPLSSPGQALVARPLAGVDSLPSLQSQYGSVVSPPPPPSQPSLASKSLPPVPNIVASEGSQSQKGPNSSPNFDADLPGNHSLPHDLSPSPAPTPISAGNHPAESILMENDDKGRKSKLSSDSRLGADTPGSLSAAAESPPTNSGILPNETQPTDDGSSSRRHDSVSPKLPDVAHISVFGPDLFARSKVTSDFPPDLSDKVAALLSSAPAPSEEADQEQALNTNSEHKSSQCSDTELAAAANEAPQQTTSGQEHKLDSTSSLATGNPLGDSPFANASASNHAVERSPSEGISATEPSPAPADNVQLEAAVASSHRRPLDLKPESIWPSVAPLRTPSPRKTLEMGLDLEDQPAEVDTHSMIRNAKPVEFERREQYSGPDVSDQSATGHPTAAAAAAAAASTATSSPIKQSDLLRDEILRRLGPDEPLPPSGTLSGDNVAQSAPSRDRDMWEKGGYNENENNTPAKLESAVDPKTNTGASSTALSASDPSWLSPNEAEGGGGTVEAAEKQAHRRKFSWEMENDGATAIVSTGSSSHIPTKTEVAEVQSQLSPVSSENQRAQDGPAPVGHQVSPSAAPAGSQDACTHSAQEQCAVPEPSSPASVMSGEHTATAPLTHDDMASGMMPELKSPSPPAEPSTVFREALPRPRTSQSPGQPRQKQIMSFREIMGMPTSADRIAKYAETQRHFASMHSGLEPWLVALRTQHAEQTRGLVSASTPALESFPQDAAGPRSPGIQISPQQPYFQQYLNATAPSTSMSTARSRLGGMQMTSPTSGSSFGHSGNQIGTKGKELMQTAGKMGKGLLSKGRSKLRASGDKVFH